MTLLAGLWQDEYRGHRCVVGIKNGVVKHFWFTTADDAEAKAQALDKSGHDVYFAPAQFDPDSVKRLRSTINPKTNAPFSGRQADAVGGVSGLWIDLDWGPEKAYKSFNDMMQAFTDWWQDNNIPNPSYIVGSGRGVHVYWLLDRPYAPADWSPVAQHLKQACAVQGLKIDVTRTADSASLLRVPGTHHRKDPSTPLDVKLLVNKPNPIPLAEFSSALPNVGPQRAVPSGPKLPPSEWDVDEPLPPGDFKAIAKKCQQIGHYAFVKGKVSEPYWRAALSVLIRCEGGDELIHTLSIGDERYNAQETEDKARNTGGPATCAHFMDINPDKCKDCPFSGKITSPINLGMASEKITEPAADGGEAVEISVPSRYTVNKTGVYLKASEDAPPTRLTAVPIWLSDIRITARTEAERGASHLHLRWRDLHDNLTGAMIDQAEVHEERALKKWLADHNLAAFVYGAKGFSMYINNLVAEHFRQRGATTVYQQLGWHDDLFVLGKHAVSEEGLEDVVVHSSNTIAQLGVEGELSDWKKGIKLLAKPEYQSHAFALCASLGAPLLELMKKDAAVVAFVGDSGRGKTLAAFVGISVFVDPNLTKEAGVSTDAGLELRLSANRHVPVLVDEVTTMNNKRLANLLYTAANGTGKATATRDRKDRKRSTWRTITFLTSNHSIMDQAANEIEEAHRQRLLEIPFVNTVPKKDAAVLYAAVTENFGVAAVPYLQFIMKHEAVMRPLFDILQRKVEQWTDAKDANRFVTWTLTAALMGGIIGRLSGILDFNPVTVVKGTAQLVKGSYQQIEDNATRARNVLLEALNDNSRHVCFWGARQPGDYDVDGAVARVRDDDLLVQTRFLNKIFAEEKINRASIQDWLGEVGYNGETCKMRLSPNAPGSVNCYRFSMAALGVSETAIWEKSEEETSSGNATN